MEIDPDGKILVSVGSVKDNKTTETSGKTFETILKGLFGDPNPVDEGGNRTPKIVDSSAMQLNVFPSEGEIFAVERAEKLLDILEEYQQKLANPEFTLRDIDPLIGKLEACNESLVSSVNSLVTGDELKNILNQVVVTSSVEILKFNRGDYVNP